MTRIPEKKSSAMETVFPCSSLSWSPDGRYLAGDTIVVDVTTGNSIWGHLIWPVVFWTLHGTQVAHGSRLQVQMVGSQFKMQRYYLNLKLRCLRRTHRRLFRPILPRLRHHQLRHPHQSQPPFPPSPPPPPPSSACASRRWCWPTGQPTACGACATASPHPSPHDRGAVRRRGAGRAHHRARRVQQARAVQKPDSAQERGLFDG